MPNARINIEKVGDIWERGWALLAWKLDSRVTVVDVVVVPTKSSAAVPGPIGEEGGRNNKYMAMVAIQKQDISNAILTVF